MKNQKKHFTTCNWQFRRYGMGCLLVIMLALFWMRGSLVYAAPSQQTVPPPTPTQETGPVPTATSVPDNNDDDDDNQPQPTATSPSAEQPTPVPPAPSEPTPSQPAPTGDGLTGVVGVARLNVRQGPGTNFDPIGTALIGQRVSILSRNEVGDWWRICCVDGTNQEGWVAAQFIQPDFELGQAATLIPVEGALPATPTPTPTVDPSTVPTTTVASAVLELQIQQEPLYTWQGQILTLAYQVTNLGETAATAVEVRNELPVELTFVTTPGIAASGVMTEATETGRTVVIFGWPAIEAGATVTTNVQLQVSAEMLVGAVVDNLAVVTADGAQPVTSGISVGMPPATLPDFR